jgi:hypothetical protein
VRDTKSRVPPSLPRRCPRPLASSASCTCALVHPVGSPSSEAAAPDSRPGTASERGLALMLSPRSRVDQRQPPAAPESGRPRPGSTTARLLCTRTTYRAHDSSVMPVCRRLIDFTVDFIDHALLIFRPLSCRLPLTLLSSSAHSLLVFRPLFAVASPAYRTLETCCATWVPCSAANVPTPPACLSLTPCPALGWGPHTGPRGAGYRHPHFDLHPWASGPTPAALCQNPAFSG